MTFVGSDAVLLRLGEALKVRGYSHITVTPATHARVNRRNGNEWATDLAGVFGWSRAFRKAAIPNEIVELMQQAGIVETSGEGWKSRLRVSTLNGCLYFHSAYPTDAADVVFFGPDTYRYVNTVIEYLSRSLGPVRRAVDIGCGAGPGAIELALRMPGVEVHAVDINDAALRMTRVNAALAGAGNIVVSKSDLLADVEGSYDLIVANPPYMMDHSARTYRHGGGDMGAGLSLAIINTALRRLAPGGTLLLYTGTAIVGGIDAFHLMASQKLNGKCQWGYQEIDPDVFGEELVRESYLDTDRIAAVMLSATMPRHV